MIFTIELDSKPISLKISEASALTDEEANFIGDIYKKHGEEIYRYAYSKLECTVCEDPVFDAEEVLMNVFLAIIKQPKKYTSLSQEEIIKQLIKDAAKESSLYIRACKKHLHDNIEDYINTAAIPENADDFFLNLVESDLKTAFLSLDRQSRSILYLSIICELSAAEISSRLKISTYSVRTKLKKAKKQIEFEIATKSL